MTTATFIALEGAGHRLRARNLFLATVLGLAPASAWACMPPFHEVVAPTLFEGEAGEAFWKYDTYEITGISRAYDLGGGYVVQHTINGNECYGEISSIAQNCATGEAVSFGGEVEAMIPGPRQEDILEELNVLLEERARLAHHLTIAEISATAAERGVEFVVPMRTTSQIRLGDYEFRLGAGCQTFYPELAGAG